MTKTKAFNIDKSLVVSAYRRVKTSAGAAGIDKQSLADFDKRLVDNLYKSGTDFLQEVISHRQ